MAIITWKTAAHWRLCAGLATGLLAACGSDSGGVTGPGPGDAGMRPIPEPEDAGRTDAGEPTPPKEFGGLIIDTKAEDQKLDLFGAAGHHFWVEVSDQQRELMNQGQGGGIGPFKKVAAKPALPPGGGGGDVVIGPGGGNFDDAGAGMDAGWILPGDDYLPYTPPGTGGHTYAKHLVVQDVISGSIADYGKVEVKLVGNNTYDAFTATTIPNLRFDMDEFTDDLTIDGFEHFRLNNNKTGKIFREAVAHRIYRAMGYPALRATHAFLGSNVWGKDNWIPMTLIEVYKQKFCDDNREALGGTCVNMWEFTEDPSYFTPTPESCQLKECDDSRMIALGKAINSAPQGAGFQDALEPFVDWERFHQFQCMSWIMWTTDDPIHAPNNAVVVEREDGKLVWLPYSVDISTGLYDSPVELYGTMSLARGCQQDPDCWAETMTSCEAMVRKFDALNPETIVDETVATITRLGMMREGDEQRAKSIRSWYAWRQKDLLTELEQYRYPPPPNCWEFGNCDAGVWTPSDAGVKSPDGGGQSGDASVPFDASVPSDAGATADAGI